MKIPVGILGATGSVGQRFLILLAQHPWFEVKALAASERSEGKKYREVVNWVQSVPIPPAFAEMRLERSAPPLPISVAFSGLDSSVAGEIETAFAEAGTVVVSNSRNHRLDPDVPLVIPEVNPDHLSLLNRQTYGKGNIVTNPNCSVIGLTLALKPLEDLFGIESVHVVTFQAISGAGYPGVASLDIMDNVIPFIGGEEQKVELEPLKILGQLREGKIEFSKIKISAHCNRVGVSDGHLECISVKFRTKPSLDQIKTAWREFNSEVGSMDLPLSPKRAIHYFEEEHFPQPRRHRDLDKGMAVSIGRLRECPLFDCKFVILSHNTIRGAAGGALLNGELMLKKGYI